MFFIVCYSCFFCLLQLDVSQFLIQFHQLHGIEPEVGVANVHVMAVAVRDDFYLFHIFLFKKFLLRVDDVCPLLLCRPDKKSGVLGSSVLLQVSDNAG